MTNTEISIECPSATINGTTDGYVLVTLEFNFEDDAYGCAEKIAELLEGMGRDALSKRLQETNADIERWNHAQDPRDKALRTKAEQRLREYADALVIDTPQETM
jgi:hypothetical protein